MTTYDSKEVFVKMEHRTSHLRELMKNYGRSAKVFAVTSGKGGVGKSNIAANLSICLAVSGKKVLALDADFSLGNLDLLLNVNSRQNVSHFLSGRNSMDEIISTTNEGVDVISGASGLQELADMSQFQRQRLLSELSRLQENNDVIILDTAAGISKSVVGFCLACDHTLVVTTPEATAMTDAYSMIKVLSLNNYSGQISLIVNMADSTSNGKRTYAQIANVARRFLGVHVYNAGILLRSSQLLSAVKMRKPVVLAYPKAKITSSLAALAAKLAQANAPNAEDNGFFRKVVDLLF